jgi:hypothetical protein
MSEADETWRAKSNDELLDAALVRSECPEAERESVLADRR